MRAVLAIIGLASLADANVPLPAPSPDARYRWVVQRGTPLDDNAEGLATNAEGEAFVVGSTEGGLDGHNSSGATDMYLMKFSPSGAWNWTVQRGTASLDKAYAVALDAAGDIFVAGNTRGDLDGNINSGDTDVFLMKISSDGRWQWTVQRGSPARDHASALAVSAEGEVFLAGYTAGGLDGNRHPGNANRDVFLMKFSRDGAWQWTAQRGSADSTEHVDGLALDPEGCALLTGYTYGGLDGNSNAGGADMFLMKFAPNGTWLWTSQQGTPEGDYAKAVAVNSRGEAFVAGHARGTVVGDGPSYNVFLTKFSPAGERQWTGLHGSAGSDFASAVAVNAEGNVFVAGYTSGNLDGNGNAGEYDAFLSTFSPGGMWQQTVGRGSSRGDYAKALAFNAEGDALVAGHTEGSMSAFPSNGARDVFLMAFPTADPPASTSTSTSFWPPATGIRAVLTDTSSDSYLLLTLAGAATLLCLSCVAVCVLSRLHRRKASEEATVFTRDWEKSASVQQQSGVGPTTLGNVHVPEIHVPDGADVAVDV